MKASLSMIVLALLFAAHVADAEEICPECDNVMKRVQASLPGTEVSGVNRSPVAGIYEVVLGQNIVYTDARGKLFLLGHIFDPKTQRDLTAERLSQVHRIDWNQLPLEDAIVSGDPKAKLKLAVFTDPDCPYCKRLEGILKDMKGVRIYTFLFPLTQLHPDARRKSEAIWCSTNPHQTMLDVMLKDINPVGRSCSNPIDRNIELAQRLGIAGTPGLVSGDGRVMQGAPERAAELLAWLKGEKGKEGEK